MALRGKDDARHEPAPRQEFGAIIEARSAELLQIKRFSVTVTDERSSSLYLADFSAISQFAHYTVRHLHTQPIGDLRPVGVDPSIASEIRMKNINAPVRSNGHFAHHIYRDNPSSSWFKRQSRRQDRRLLAVELSEQAEQIVAEAKMAAVTRADQSARTIEPTATILQFPTSEQRKQREVLVIRKLPRAAFRRQEVAVDLLAA